MTTSTAVVASRHPPDAGFAPRAAEEGHTLDCAAEILACIVEGDFDVIHCTGHGVFDPARPELRGFVVAPDRVLGARELFHARRVPRLVFASACWSAGVSGRARRRHPFEAVGVAEAFLAMGVPNFIGAAWPIDAHPAASLVAASYEAALAGERLDEALRVARRRVRAAEEGEHNTWGGFQLHGEGATRLLPDQADQAGG